MKIIKPIQITDENLLGVGLHADTTYPEWLVGTTYALGDMVQVNNPALVVTMTLAIPAVITWASHGFVVNTPIIFTTTGALPSGITSGRAYFVYSVLTNSFQISAEIGGAPIQTYGSQSGVHTATASTHKNYESLQAANTGKVPRLTTSSTWWLDRGNRNHWLMFNDSVTDQTIDDGVNAVIRINQPLDSLVLFNVGGSQLVVLVTDDVAGVVYNETHSLVSTSGISTWWEWFYLPRRRVKTFAITDLPPINAGQIEFYLTESDATLTSRIGKVVLGLSEDIGGTQYGARASITDWSTKTRDTWGNYTFVEGNFNAECNFNVTLDSGDVERTFDILAENRAKPCVYIGEEEYNPTIAFGIPRDAEISIEYPTVSILTFRVEGLT